MPLTLLRYQHIQLCGLCLRPLGAITYNLRITPKLCPICSPHEPSRHSTAPHPTTPHTTRKSTSHPKTAQVDLLTL